MQSLENGAVLKVDLRFGGLRSWYSGSYEHHERGGLHVYQDGKLVCELPSDLIKRWKVEGPDGEIIDGSWPAVS